jgi:hypothetical protein
LGFDSQGYFVRYLCIGLIISFRMNTKYLLRDELLYELVIRSVNSAGDVHLLRRHCRSVLVEDIPVTPANVACLETVELLGLTGTKVA